MTLPTRQKLYALFWASAGAVVLWRGLPYLGWADWGHVAGLQGADRWIATAIGLVFGVVQGVTALRMAGRKAVDRMVEAGAVASPLTMIKPATVLLVGVMIGLGLLVRKAPYDPGIKAWVVGILYPGVSLSLFLGCVELLRQRDIDAAPAGAPNGPARDIEAERG